MPRPSSRVPLFTQYTPQSAIEPIGASVRVRVMVCIPENNAVSYAPKQPSAIRTTCRGKFILEFRCSETRHPKTGRTPDSEYAKPADPVRRRMKT